MKEGTGVLKLGQRGCMPCWEGSLGVQLSAHAQQLLPLMVLHTAASFNYVDAGQQVSCDAQAKFKKLRRNSMKAAADLAGFLCLVRCWPLQEGQSDMPATRSTH